MYRFDVNVDLKEFDAFVASQDNAQFTQMSPWAKVKDNWKPYYTGVYHDEKLVATALVLQRSLPMKMNFLYIPRGPIMDYSDASLVEYFLLKLKQLGKNQHSLFVKFDPAILYKNFTYEEKDQAQPLAHGEAVVQRLKELNAIHKGYTIEMYENFQPRTIAMVYQDTDYLNQLPKTVKKMISQAERRMVQFQPGDLSDLEGFAQVIASTEQRKDINLRDIGYFEKIMNAFENKAFLTLSVLNVKHSYETLKNRISELETEIDAIKDKSPKKVFILQEQLTSTKRMFQEIQEEMDKNLDRVILSGILGVRTGDTVELMYSGFNMDYKLYHPQPNVYTKTINTFFQEGVKYVSIGGVSSDVSDGLSQFKMSLNAQFNEYIGEFDLPTSFLYPLFTVANRLREKMKEIRKKRLG